MNTFTINTMRALVCVLSLLPHASGAATLYRCKAAALAVSYQAEPCAAGAKTLSTVDYQPEPASVPAPMLQSAPSRRVRAKARTVADAGYRRVAPRRSEPAPESCAQVRQRRDDWEREVGLKRRYDELRAWTDRVRRACP